MDKGSQGYLGELYIQTGSLFYSSFTKVGVIQDFALSIVSGTKNISTIGSLSKNKNFKNFESSFKSWSFTFKKLYIDSSLDNNTLAECFENATKIWIKIIPRKNFSYGGYRKFFLGYGLISENSLLNSITGAVSNTSKIVGVSPIFTLKENENGIIFFDEICVESILVNGGNPLSLEWSDLYTSLPCSGGWSEPVYISTGNVPSSADWTETSCVGSYRKFAGYFGVAFGLPSPPIGQTTTPPPTPVIPIPPACIASAVVGKRWGNEIGDEVLLFGTQGPVYDAKNLYRDNLFGLMWTPVLPHNPSPIQLSWASNQTCNSQWGAGGYSGPPFGLNGFGATVPGHNKYLNDFGSLKPFSQGKANNSANGTGTNQGDGSYIRAIPPNSPEGNCVVDSGACDFTYDAVMMLTNGAFNHSIDIWIEFFSDALGANLLATFNMPNYNIHSGVTWTNTNITGNVPIGARFYSVNVRFNNPNLLAFIYGYVVEHTGMRFQY